MTEHKTQIQQFDEQFPHRVVYASDRGRKYVICLSDPHPMPLFEKNKATGKVERVGFTRPVVEYHVYPEAFCYGYADTRDEALVDAGLSIERRAQRMEKLVAEGKFMDAYRHSLTFELTRHILDAAGVDYEWPPVVWEDEQKTVEA